MDSTRFSSASVIFGTLLLLQVVYEGCSARKMGMIQERGLQHDSPPPTSSSYMDPQLNVFFTPNDLEIGKRLPVFFDINDRSTYPHLLSREEADSIPFSSADLPYLLDFFSFSAASPQATAMAETLRHCEFRPMEGETKFCATSLESMLDSTRETFGSGSKLRVLATKFVTKPPSVSLQNYTVAAAPREIPAEKMVGCHALPYPYAVFYCHSQQKNKVLRISLVGENGEDRVDAVGVCHMDTGKWNPNHVSFRVLGIQPGASPVCHFFPVDNLVWLPLP
ncbi:PREDICTED: BURP domain-containing protein BNM2C-like [Ipomoea nil]|uniref:BURP domain-containing protein BNM2C-like n=1 Tax=Ipomoea nil TaxID=35883 RepID=UPI0009013857|nr:PREDICTED: BURP domain-containing protein BNM2C-like [Ipomoea nil]